MNLLEMAARIGAHDVFVLRRIGDNRYFNVAGVGRGAGWAGNISIDATAEPWLSIVLANGMESRRSGIPFRVFGPYWAAEVTGVTADDALIVFAGQGVASVNPEILLDVTRGIAASACEVSIEKREADEMELKQTIETINSITATTPDEAALEVVRAAARALSCEFGALLLYGSPMRIFVADEGWRPAATDEELIAAIYPLTNLAVDGAFLEQDLSTSPHAYPPLSFGDGLVARCTVPVGPQGSLGIVVVAHAGTAPRGFTSLCREVASVIGERAASVLTHPKETNRS